MRIFYKLSDSFHRDFYQFLKNVERPKIIIRSPLVASLSYQPTDMSAAVCNGFSRRPSSVRIVIYNDLPRYITICNDMLGAHIRSAAHYLSALGDSPI